jgi:spore germination protein YaaH
MLRTVVPLLALLLTGAVSPLPPRPIVTPEPAEPLSIHALEAARHPWDPRTMDVPLRPSPRVSDVRLKPGRIVYGYFPYWAAATSTIRWDLLSHFAYFDAPITAAGTLAAVGRERLESARFAAFRDEAALRGVTFVVTFTNFAKLEIGELVGPLRTTTIDTIVGAVKSSGARGANIDFETVPGSSRAAFVEFMAELTTRLHAEVPGSHVTSATPIIDWSNAYDVPGLLSRSDGVMVMVYGCSWGAAPRAGPTSPLAPSTLWGNCSLRHALDSYRPPGTELLQNKVIAGLPLYGYLWETADATPRSATVGTGRSRTWSDCRPLFDRGGRLWDGDSDTPWTTFLDGSRRMQVWCEDTESLRSKLQLASERAVGGIGLWALGNEGDDASVWDRIASVFGEAVPVDPPDPPESLNTAPIAQLGASQRVPVGRLAVLDGTASADPDGDSLSFAWSQVGGPPVELVNPGALVSFTPTVAGAYAFELVVNDGALDSEPARIEVEVVEPERGGGGDVPAGACGCGPGGGAPGLALLLVARRNRRRSA